MGLGHHPTEDAYAFCGAQDNGGLRYQGDEVWDHQLPGDGGATVIDWNTGERLLSIYIRNRSGGPAPTGRGTTIADVGPSGAKPILFYPPLVGTPPSANPADAAVVALGAENPWLSTNFGGSWTQLPAACCRLRPRRRRSPADRCCARCAWPRRRGSTADGPTAPSPART